MFRLTHCILVLSVNVSLGATGGEEEDVVVFVGGDSAGEDEGMSLCIGGDEVWDPLDVIQVQDPGSVKPTTRLLLSGDDTVFLVPPDGVGDLVEVHTRKQSILGKYHKHNLWAMHNNLYR